MRKVRHDALWNELTTEQLETLDGWLFEEKLSYTAALDRAQTELGYKGGRSSLKRYYDRRRHERILENFEDLREDLAELNGAPGDPAALRGAAQKLTGLFLIRRMQESPNEVKEWGPVANLMARNEYNDLIREAKAEEVKVRREAMAFAKEKYHFDIMEKAMTALPQLRALEEAKKDPQIKRYEENARWNRLRRQMFGIGLEVHPESAQEEAEMLAAKRIRDGRPPLREGEVETEIMTEAGPPGPSNQYYQEYMAAQAKRRKPIGMQNDE